MSAPGPAHRLTANLVQRAQGASVGLQPLARARINGPPRCCFADWSAVEPLEYLSPFLEVIKSPETSGPITAVALTSVNKFLERDILGAGPQCWWRVASDGSRGWPAAAVAAGRQPVLPQQPAVPAAECIAALSRQNLQRSATRDSSRQPGMGAV